MAAASAGAQLGFPFTAAQWNELQRQAMIYKYMIASLPVPSDLLLPADPIAASPLAGSHGEGGGSIFNLRYGNIRDAVEPGRCKRTDGKKWRCSRDVAPHQKYCERHMHRGRPRSRKPVEQHQFSSSSPPDKYNSSKKSRLPHTSLQETHIITQPNNHSSTHDLLGTCSTIQQQHPNKEPQLVDASAPHNTSSIFASSYTHKEPNRLLGWAVDSEVVAANPVDQDSLHLLMETKRIGELLAPSVQDYTYGTNDATTLQQGYGGEDPLNLFSYATEIPYPEGTHSSQNDESHMFLNSDLIATEQPQVDQHCTSRGFIDAWSDGDLKTIDRSSEPPSIGNDLSPSSLTLSMPMVGGSALDEEGMGLVASDTQPNDCLPVSWLPFTSGGPLAEVLQPNTTVAFGSNPASSYTSNGDSASPPATAVSSPTAGIFHRADNSVCNSPTLAPSAAPPELIAFQWLN